MRASAMNGLEVKVQWDSADKVVAVVRLYPNEIRIEVPRESNYAELFDKIKLAFLELYAEKDV